MKKILLTQVLMFGIAALSHAQTERYAGLAVSNVIGPSYTLRHNRWSAVADAGWLTGFNGMYASVGGMYRILSMNKILKFFGRRELNGRDMLISMGLGLFAQDYYSPSDRQKRWADKLAYVAPLGSSALLEFYFRYETLPNWNFAYRCRMSAYFTAKEYEDVFSKGASVAIPAVFQIVVQRRF